MWWCVVDCGCVLLLLCEMLDAGCGPHCHNLYCCVSSVYFFSHHNACAADDIIFSHKKIKILYSRGERGEGFIYLFIFLQALFCLLSSRHSSGSFFVFSTFFFFFRGFRGCGRIVYRGLGLRMTIW